MSKGSLIRRHYAVTKPQRNVGSLSCLRSTAFRRPAGGVRKPGTRPLGKLAGDEDGAAAVAILDDFHEIGCSEAAPPAGLLVSERNPIEGLQQKCAMQPVESTSSAVGVDLGEFTIQRAQHLTDDAEDQPQQ
jgi:hypothetical protein